MRVNRFLAFGLLLVTISLSAQDELNQRILGKVEDEFHAPLNGAGVTLSRGSEIVTAISDAAGVFVFNVKPGRYSLRVTFTGYQFWQQEILVISSRPTEVLITLEDIPNVLEEVEISARTMNDQLGEQTITIEKTLRVPANFFDPVRVVTAYPGVMTANDQNNTIVIRGNSPAGLLWRINGLDVVNPNHLANAGTFSDKPASYGGGVNIISSQLMDRTDFYAGSLPVRYGNALSGVVDMSLREGNKEENHYTLQASLIGIDAAVEGPVGKNHNTSFLVNYRSSTVGILSAMGVQFGDEDITFQDLTFSIDSKLQKGKRLSFFGFFGNSKNNFDHKESGEWEVDKDQYDIDYSSTNVGMGLNFLQPFSKFSIRSGIAVSGSDQERDQVASPDIAPNTLGVTHADQFDAQKILVSAFGRMTASINSTQLETGLIVNYMSDEVSTFSQVDNLPSTTMEGTIGGFLLQPYAQWRIFLSERWVSQAAMRYMYYSYNSKGSLEPRITFEFFPKGESSFKFSYNLVSQLQSPGTYLNNNADLELNKAHHIDVGYILNTDHGFRLSSTVYYQRLFDIPVEKIASSYSPINSIEEFAKSDLISKGRGDNYGLEILTEKSFVDQSYFILGGSWYRSTYEGSDEISRSTRFDGNYNVNLTYGKEWNKARKKSQRTFGVSSRLLYLGGLHETPISPDDNVAGTVYDESKAFENKLQDYFRLDLRVNWRKNKRGYTRTIAIDIQNLFNIQNEAYHYYDHVKNKIETQYQLGIIPVLVYRIEF